MGDREDPESETVVERPSDDGDDNTAATMREGPGLRPSGSQRSRPPSAGDDAPPLERGARLGRYVVLDVLGAGGMGVVYAAQDPELDRKVAIKVLQAHHGGSESGGQTWLVREAQAMARLAHPNVVTVYDVGEVSSDRVFVAMELVDGVTLRAWLRQRPRSWREVVPVMRAAGTGLAAAHAVGLVHRDFKPDNVLVGNDGRVRVMDFGLARLHAAGDHASHDATSGTLDVESKSPLSERLTVTGAVLGTPAYLAPEVHAGHAADARVDQFAFGVALYEALYRRRPYDRQALIERRAVPPTPPPDAKVPAWIERIVLRATALDPEQRFASMDELLAALGRDPTTRRRRIAAGVSFIAAWGVLVAVGLTLRGADSGEPAPPPCTDAPDRLAGVWDAPTRATLETAFRRIDKPFVDDAIAGTEKTLDRYAAGWVAQRTEACQATRVHGFQSEDVMTLRMTCLDNRLAELRTLVGLFGKADEKLVLGGATAAQKLSPLSDCADIPALLAPDPLPKDPAARTAVTTQQRELAKARTLYRASRLADAHAVLDRIAPAIARLHHLPTEATFHMLNGQTRWVLEGADKGEPELRKAVIAAEAGKADRVKVEAGIQLANLANETSHFDLARERLQQASAALERLGQQGHDWVLRTRALASEALLDLRTSHHDDALAIAKKGRLLAEKHTEPPHQAYSQLVEASILNATGHHAEALVQFEKVLAYQESLGHRRVETATTLHAMATAELVIGKYDDATKHLTSALEIERAIYGDTNKLVANTLSGLAAAQGAKGDLEGELATSREALEMTERTVGKNEPQYALILGQIAETLVNSKRPKEAIGYLDRAIAIQSAKLGRDHFQTLTLRLTKCDAEHGSGATKAAIATCKSALAAAERTLGPESPLVFVFLAHTGIVLTDGHEAREAHALFERALQLGAADISDVYYVQMLDAKALWAMGKHAPAIARAQKARDGFATLGDAKADQRKDAEAWLANHRR